ncbi:hypothetical protein BDV93DRAFT_562320 [Ceratobasidium sp. AG-I]|nr:hypothetical protein BDV93DRAFT_562320 [Ceratobasidium sp. AG-I]
MLETAIPPEIPPLREKRRFLLDEALGNAPTKVSQASTIKAVGGQLDEPTSNVPATTPSLQLESHQIQWMTWDGKVEENEPAEECQAIEEDGQSVGEGSKSNNNDCAKSSPNCRASLRISYTPMQLPRMDSQFPLSLHLILLLSDPPRYCLLIRAVSWRPLLEAGKYPEAAQLKWVLDDQFETALMKATWQAMVGVWKKLKGSTYDSARETKNFKTRYYNRKGNVSLSLNTRQESGTLAAADFWSDQVFATGKPAVAVPKLPKLPQPAAADEPELLIDCAGSLDSAML